MIGPQGANVFILHRFSIATIFPMERIGLSAQMACLWEATARKPGNVHRERDFDDLTYLDFAMSAAAIAPVFADCTNRRVGELILAAIRATRQLVPTNTNLGIVLLLAPLAVVPSRESLPQGLSNVLDSLDVADSRAVFEAIRVSQPTGLGRVENQDVATEPTLPLREVMALAADRDLVARQYANGFREVFDDGVPALVAGIEKTRCLEGAIIHCHLTLLAKHPDSLIARKRGLREAEEASRRALAVLEGRTEIADLDTWLRAEGRGRNPGTTADLVAASLFVALRTQVLTLPLSVPWTIADR
jgi:triphosphoribosyl-dephospho-CoA synthase